MTFESSVRAQPSTLSTMSEESADATLLRLSGRNKHDLRLEWQQLQQHTHTHVEILPGVILELLPAVTALSCLHYICIPKNELQKHHKYALTLTAGNKEILWSK